MATLRAKAKAQTAIPGAVSVLRMATLSLTITKAKRPSPPAWGAQDWADVWLGVGCTNFSFCGPKSVAKKQLLAAKTEIRTPDPLSSRGTRTE